MSDGMIAIEVENWLEQVVIGLNLCPFAKHPWEMNKVHLKLSHAQNDHTLLEDLAMEIEELLSLPVAGRETTVLIVAEHLKDFESYNQFLDWVDSLLEQQGWGGTIQVASFHPQYQFDGTHVDDSENLTNRAPYPLLHILREESIEKALQSYPNSSEDIFTNNIRTMQDLNEEQKLRLFPHLFGKGHD